MDSCNNSNVQQFYDEAAVAAHFSYGIKLSHTRLREFAIKVIESKDSRLPTYHAEAFKKTHHDFNQTIYFIQNNWNLGGFSKLPNQSILWSYLQRATAIRNFVSHQQTFTDSDSSDRAIETLVHIAKEIGFPDEAQRIWNYNKPSLLPENAKLVLTWEQLRQQGNAYYKEGRYTEAMISYTKALKENANEPVLYSNRALCEMNLDRLEDARNDAEDAVELDPKNVKYYRILSEALHKLELIAEALSVCLRGLQLDSKDEILLIRERNLKSVVRIQQTTRHPRADPKLLIENSATGERDFHSFSRLYGDLKPNASDICYVEEAQVEKYLTEYLKLDDAVREGHKHRLGIHGYAKNERRAFELFKEAADLGSAEGQYNVGMMCQTGCGTIVDYAVMLTYFQLAAHHKAFIQLPAQLMPQTGVVDAENALGDVFRHGTGVDIDLKKAFSHYIKAAGWGLPEAQNNAGWCLQWGKGVQKNADFARTWYERAAKAGLAEAQLNFAEMLDKGEGGTRDESKAFVYYKKSAEQGSPGAIEKLQRLARNGSANRDQQQSFVEMLWKKSESGTDPCALFFMGNELKDMDDFENALVYYKKAAEKGHLESKVALWNLLLKLERNTEAFSYSSEASLAGDARSQMMLAVLLLRGIGCKRDTRTATRWFQRAQHRLTPIITMENFQQLVDSAEAVCKFEEDLLLSTNMSWNHRVQRYLRSGNKIPPMALDVYDKLIENSKTPKIVPTNTREFTAEGLQAVFIAANNGSLVAQDFLQAKMMIKEAFLAWEYGDDERAFFLLRESYRYDNIIRFHSPDMASYIDDNNLCTADALFVRACNFYNDVKGNIDFLERCIRLHPTVAEFHEILSCCYGFTDKMDACLIAARRAYELEPRPNWLYNIAAATRILWDKTAPIKLLPSSTAGDIKETTENNKISSKQVIAAYERYLQENPKDERKVPSALFCIASMYAFSELESFDALEKTRTYYEKACAADAARLHCFVAVEDTFPPKFFVKTVLTAFLSRGLLSGATVSATYLQNVKEPECDQCGKQNPPSRCVCRKAVYCGKECQKLHWRNHKLLCSAKSSQPSKEVHHPQGGGS